MISQTALARASALSRLSTLHSNYNPPIFFLRFRAHKSETRKRQGKKNDRSSDSASIIGIAPASIRNIAKGHILARHDTLAQVFHDEVGVLYVRYRELLTLQSELYPLLLSETLASSTLQAATMDVSFSLPPITLFTLSRVPLKYALEALGFFCLRINFIAGGWWWWFFFGAASQS